MLNSMRLSFLSKKELLVNVHFHFHLMPLKPLPSFINLQLPQCWLSSEKLRPQFMVIGLVQKSLKKY